MGSWLPIVMLAVSVPVALSLSVTRSVAVYVPTVAYVHVVPVGDVVETSNVPLPSQSHSYRTIEPSGSVEPNANTGTPTP